MTLLPHETGEMRPPGVPEQAQKLLLPELCKLGDIPRGPRGGFMLVRMRVWPIDLSGKIRRAYVDPDTGDFRLEVYHSSRWHKVRFTEPDAARRAAWLFTTDQERAERRSHFEAYRNAQQTRSTP